MKVTELKSEGLSKSYKIVIPSAEINKAIDARLLEVASTAKIDGFRPGKIPMPIVKSRFNETTELGKELALYNIVINKKFNNDAKADYFINEVIKERRILNLENHQL